MCASLQSNPLAFSATCVMYVCYYCDVQRQWGSGLLMHLLLQHNSFSDESGEKIN